MLAVAVIGARRKRQGIGAHVARYLARHGAEVRAIVGTTHDTVNEARQALEAIAGIGCRGYTSLDALLEGEPGLEALAICSPIPLHGAALEAAAAAGLHALCEKPLIYEPALIGPLSSERAITGRDAKLDLGAAVRDLCRRFAERGRLLASITQWPCTLDGFRRLYPDLNVMRLERFKMRLSPTSRGSAMLVDSLPHPLSMLRALVGPGRVRFGGIAWEGDEAATVRFGYEHARGRVEAELELRRCEEQPRPASYAIDGREARRDVRLPEYTMDLVAGERRVKIEDPLELLVQDFLGRVARGEGPDAEGLASDAAALQAIMSQVE